MLEYKNRTYREHLQKGRWHAFTVAYKETDLWIGIDKESFRATIPGFTESRIRALRDTMDAYLANDPEYAATLVAREAQPDAPAIFLEMSKAARQSGIGPMSAVAGAVAHRVALDIKKKYGVREIIVENGGDIYADIRDNMDIAVFAGTSPLSEKVGFTIPAGYAPLGICTSSGTVGPSLSFGKADAVMIVCKDCALADTYATAFANEIKTTDDIAPCIKKIGEIEDILAAICIKDDKIGIHGIFDLKLFQI